MGTIIAGLNETVDGNTNKEPNGTTASGSSSSTTSTTTTESRGSGGSGSGRSGSGRTETREETKQTSEADKLALLTKEELEEYNNSDEENKKRLLRNAQRRDRYAKQKANDGGQVKPRKVRQTKKPAEVKPNMDTTQLNAIVLTLSTVVASRPNCEHWLLTQKEIESITTPLAKMMEESKALETIGQYSNQIALTIACVSVFVPRLIITVQKQKEEKARAISGQSTNTTVKPDKGRNSGEKKTDNQKVNRDNARHTSTDGTDNSKNEPYYGLPIC